MTHRTPLTGLPLPWDAVVQLGRFLVLANYASMQSATVLILHNDTEAQGLVSQKILSETIHFAEL